MEKLSETDNRLLDLVVELEPHAVDAILGESRAARKKAARISRVLIRQMWEIWDIAPGKCDSARSRLQNLHETLLQHRPEPTSGGPLIKEVARFLSIM